MSIIMSMIMSIISSLTFATDREYGKAVKMLERERLKWERDYMDYCEVRCKLL